MSEGGILYVIGASGSGKDSLMRYARERLAADPSVLFAHRYITRPVELNGENHVALSEIEFEARLAKGLFAMHWNSHGLRYGIGCELHQWLAKGLTVVVNGSRAYLDEASRNYPEFRPVLVEVSPEVLRLRLRSRGRESESNIEARLTRACEFKDVRHPKLLRLSNDAPLSETGPAFVALIRAQSPVTTCA